MWCTATPVPMWEKALTRFIIYSEEFQLYFYMKILNFNFIKLICIFMASNKESDLDKDLNDYEILRDDYPTFDIAFKVIIIGDSGKK